MMSKSDALELHASLILVHVHRVGTRAERIVDAAVSAEQARIAVGDDQYPAFVAGLAAAGVLQAHRNARNGLNLVPLDSLRAATGLPLTMFVRALWCARVANLVVLHTHDGRHGQLTEAEQSAVISESGRRFAYAAVRGD